MFAQVILQPGAQSDSPPCESGIIVGKTEVQEGVRLEREAFRQTDGVTEVRIEGVVEVIGPLIEFDKFI